MARVEQSYKEHTKAIDKNGGYTSAEIPYIVFDVADEDEALAAVLAEAPKTCSDLPLDSIEGIRPGDMVSATDKPRMVCVGPQLMGRVLNGLGEPIDGKGPLSGQLRPIDNTSPAPLQRDVDWYNHRRLHGEIGLIPPAEFEANHRASQPTKHYRQNPVRTEVGSN